MDHISRTYDYINAFSGIWWAASTLLTVGYESVMQFIKVNISEGDRVFMYTKMHLGNVGHIEI